MNEFAQIFGYALQTLPLITAGIQTVYGDTKAGKDKEAIAYDTLGIALQGATSMLPAGSDNAALAQGAAATAAVGINLASNIGKLIDLFKKHDQVTKVVNLQKADGSYQAATALAVAK